MINNLLDEGKEEQIKMIVVDEIHLLADQHRGFLLEVILSKIQYILREQVQIVGMSATLPNISDLSGWLGASLYRTEFRPVDLSVRVCMNRKLYRVALLEDSPRVGVGRVGDGAVSVSVPVVKSSAVCNNSVSIYSTAATKAATSNAVNAGAGDGRGSAMVAARLDVDVRSDIDKEGDSGSDESDFKPSISEVECVIPNIDDVIMDIDDDSNSMSVPTRSVRYRPSCLTQLTDNMRISDGMANGQDLRSGPESGPMEMQVEEEEVVEAAGKGTQSAVHSSPCTARGITAPSVIKMTITSDPPGVDPELELQSPILKLEFDTSNYDFEFIREIPPILTQGPGSKGRTDPDSLYALCVEPLLIGKSVMLFCPSKGRCEVCASEVARIVQTCAALCGGDKDSVMPVSSSSSGGSSRGHGTGHVITSDPQPSPLPPIQLPDRTAARAALLNELRLAPVRLCEVMTSLPVCPLDFSTIVTMIVTVVASTLLFLISFNRLFSHSCTHSVILLKLCILCLPYITHSCYLIRGS
jgi:DEAD/DEAH box helicase